MTREYAIKILTNHTQYKCNGEDLMALDMAIKALEQEPFINKPCVSSGVCEHDKNEVLDKIKAEILEEHENAYAREDNDVAYGLSVALDIIDKHKAEVKK